MCRNTVEETIRNRRCSSRAMGEDTTLQQIDRGISGDQSQETSDLGGRGEGDEQQVVPTPSPIAAPSQRKLSGTPASATPLRASSHAAIQAAIYSPADARVASTASSANDPVSARTMARAA